MTMINPVTLISKYWLLIGLTALKITLLAKDDNDPEKLINSINSVKQVKKDIKQTIQDMDNCAVGSCFNYTSTFICEMVAALDVKVNGQIIKQMSSEGGQGDIAISNEDLNLMKLIFSQCKPTNYQY